MLTLNNKCILLMERLEVAIKQDEKKLPLMLKTMYKPMLATIKLLLSALAEETLRNYMENSHIMLEALQCVHETDEDFLHHISELIKLWI